jgi:hypothetical protein
MMAATLINAAFSHQLSAVGKSGPSQGSPMVES